MEPITLLIVCPMVFLAGVMDSIAGGGGLISLPAYLLAGLPGHAALGTNKLSSTIGTAVATGRLAHAGFIKWKLALPAAVGAIAGSAVGAQLALLTPEGIFEMLMIVALPAIALAVLRKRTFADDDAPSDLPLKRQLAIVLACSLAIGCYDGFYGPGTGTFLLLAFTMFAHMPVKEASGGVKVANLASNVAALVTFLMHGAVWVELGLAAAAFSILGNYLGASLVVKDGAKVVRPMVIAVLCLLFVKLFSDVVL